LVVNLIVSSRFCDESFLVSVLVQDNKHKKPTERSSILINKI
jgi:hypothetical protein